MPEPEPTVGPDHRAVSDNRWSEERGQVSRDGVTADANPASAEAARLVAETERLAALKRALWDSFQVAPQSPVRAPIVDVTMAYTDALRLELRLRASSKTLAVTPRIPPKPGFRGE